jgi:heme/copper-type cytochrome/quinol oxidase subunit 2
VALLLYLCAIVALAGELDLLSRIEAGTPVTLAEIESSDSFVLTCRVLTALAFVVGGIAFSMWIYRAYSNAESLSTELEFSPGWAIGSWLIPILAL